MEGGENGFPVPLLCDAMPQHGHWVAVFQSLPGACQVAQGWAADGLPFIAQTGPCEQAGQREIHVVLGKG